MGRGGRGGERLQIFERGAVGFEEAGAEFPAEVVLSDLEEERVPAGFEGDVGFVGAGLEGTGGAPRCR